MPGSSGRPSGTTRRRRFAPRVVAAVLVLGVGLVTALGLIPASGGTGHGGRPAKAEKTKPPPGPRDDVRGGGHATDLADLADLEGEMRQVRLRVGDLTRTVFLYEPEHHAPGSPAFVVVHGYTDDATGMMEHTGFLAQAQRYGWIVAFPLGLTYADGERAWNAGTCCDEAPRARTPDVDFLSDLARTLVSSYGAGDGHVYYSGYSNGAMLGYRIACTPGQPYDGFALLSGTSVSRCRNAPGVPVLAVHGLRDAVVPYPGTRYSASLRTRLPAVRTSVEAVAARNGCGPLTYRTAAAERVRILQGTRCPDGRLVQLVTVRGLHHQFTDDVDRYGLGETAYTTRWLLAHA